MPTTKKTETICITKPAWDVIKVPIIGKTPLMTQSLNQETVMGFIAREFGEQPAKKLRNADEEYERAFYRNDKKEPCIPSGAIWKSMLNATVDMEVAKTQLRRTVRLQGELYPIEYSKIEKDERPGRRAGQNRTPNMIYRPVFHNWKVVITIGYNPNVITEETILNLINTAGISTGIGSYRPECDGRFGTFEVDIKRMSTKKWKEELGAST